MRRRTGHPQFLGVNAKAILARRLSILKHSSNSILSRGMRSQCICRGLGCSLKSTGVNCRCSERRIICLRHVNNRRIASAALRQVPKGMGLQGGSKWPSSGRMALLMARKLCPWNCRTDQGCKKSYNLWRFLPVLHGLAGPDPEPGRLYLCLRL